MDFDKALAFLETYSREYLLYLMDFFSRRQGEVRTEPSAPEGKVVVYALISASIGLFLTFKFVGLKDLTGEAFAIQLFVKFAYWLSLALALHVLLIMTGARPDFMLALLATLTVMPVAYALGGYAAYLMNKLSWFWVDTSINEVAAKLAKQIKPQDPNRVRAGYGYLGAVVTQIIVAATYFPRVLARAPELGRRQVIVGSVGILALIIGIQIASLVELAYGKRP